MEDTKIDDDAPFALTAAQQGFFETAFHSGYNRWAGLKLLELKPGFARIGFTPRVEMLTHGAR
jgi:hypothetical protein